MKRHIVLLMFLAISSAVPSKPKQEPDVVDIGEGEDVDISDINKDLMKDDILEDPNLKKSATTRMKLWTSPVPYVLTEGLDINSKGVILRAFDHFRVKSCIDFKLWDSEDYYISVEKLSGCFSSVGRTTRGGQVLSIGRGCGGISTIEHEFLHALGFYHEQSRYDRDDYVRIVAENIIEGYKLNFRKQSSEVTTTHGVEYDYSSVMHYSKNAFSNGNGSTIETLDPKYQDVIGQRLEMSPSDVLELNLLYKCNSTAAFQMHCGFYKGNMCGMTHCTQSLISWEMVTDVKGGPSSDHTNLSSASGGHGGNGKFMHVSTAVGKEGDSAWLETHRMSPKRDCHVQCLQFYYYHSGNESDTLNIWLREFQGEEDSKGTVRLMGQITGSPTSHWKLHHVPLTASKQFQVELEVRKGAGSSAGGFSVDDINLSETECPHLTMQVDNFEERLTSGEYGATIYSPRHYSADGYAYRIAVRLYRTYVGLFVQLLSGDNDDKLKWPCPYRQVNMQVLDQDPNIQLQMSKQQSITSDPELLVSSGVYVWDNPRKNGETFTDENNEKAFAGFLIGRSSFISLEDMKSRQFLKGQSAIFIASFQDITPLLKGSVLPCPTVSPVKLRPSPRSQDEGPCSIRTIKTTTAAPLTTTEEMWTTQTTGLPLLTTDDNSIFGFSPALMASPVLTVLLALMMLLMP